MKNCNICDKDFEGYSYRLETVCSDCHTKHVITRDFEEITIDFDEGMSKSKKILLVLVSVGIIGLSYWIFSL